MIKSKKGTAEISGNECEVFADYMVITQGLCKMLQDREDMEREKAEEKIREMVDIALLPEEDLEPKLEDMKRKMLGEVLDMMKDISSFLGKDHGENVEKQEGGACDDCCSEGACRCGTDETDS